MGLDVKHSDGQTPLNEEEKEGLLIPTIGTHGELDEYEQQNIEHAIQWTIGRTFKPEVIFTEGFVRTVHKRMLAEVWSWAGEFRKSNKNFGTDKWQIAIELKYLLDDALHWYENKTFLPDEIAIRFKHRIVSIHCFPNGNGRHSRLMADIIVGKIYQKPVFSWGSASQIDGVSRASYLKAVKAADKGDYRPLLDFARS